MEGRFIKIIGLKFDVLEGLQIINESNVKNHIEAGHFAEDHGDGNTIFIGIPCTYSCK